MRSRRKRVARIAGLRVAVVGWAGDLGGVETDGLNFSPRLKRVYVVSLDSNSIRAAGRISAQGAGLNCEGDGLTSGGA
jgi:hypothetical protein